MFLIIVPISPALERSSTSEVFKLTEVSLEQKYLKQPVVYLSGCNTFSEGLPFPDYLNQAHSALLLVYY